MTLALGGGLSAAMVANLLHSARSVRKFVAVIGGYIDGSNLHDGADVVIVAAWATDTDTWTKWQAAWSGLINFINRETKCRIQRWHHVEFINKRGKFGAITDAEWRVARKMLCDVFALATPHGFAEAVFRSDYEAVRSGAMHLPADPYYFLLDQVLQHLIHGLFAHPKDEGVLVYCDRDKNEQLVLSLAKWHEEYLRAKPAEIDIHGDRNRPVLTAYGSDIDYVPIQAADVLAYETTLLARLRGPDPSLGGMIPANSFIMERLVKSCHVSLTLHTRPLLQMEADGSAYPDGHRPGLAFRPPQSDG